VLVFGTEGMMRNQPHERPQPLLSERSAGAAATRVETLKSSDKSKQHLRSMLTARQQKIGWELEQPNREKISRLRQLFHEKISNVLVKISDVFVKKSATFS
jgi:hypothetical protein